MGQDLLHIWTIEAHETAHVRHKWGDIVASEIPRMRKGLVQIRRQSSLVGRVREVEGKAVDATEVVPRAGGVLPASPIRNHPLRETPVLDVQIAREWGTLVVPVFGRHELAKKNNGLQSFAYKWERKGLRLVEELLRSDLPKCIGRALRLRTLCLLDKRLDEVHGQ